jgi:hypothetical protein
MFEGLVARFTANPKLVVTLEYVQMMDFIFKVYEKGNEELCEKLIHAAIDRYGDGIVEEIMDRAAIVTEAKIAMSLIQLN